MVFDFSSFREQNVSRNTELLLATDIAKLPTAPFPGSTTPKKPRTSTQKVRVERTSTPRGAPASTNPDVEAEERDKAGLRSSSRVRRQSMDAEKSKEEAKKLRDLKDNGFDEEDSSYWEDGKQLKTERGYAPEKLGKRLYNPKRFGHIPGVAIGTTFNFRMEASQAAIHAPVVAGISGSPDAGTWSIAVSGGYVDDVDLGYRLTFSGSGGRDLKGTAKTPKNLRTAPQSADQTWDGLNAALKRSVDLKKPIRVLRGFKGKSAFAPEEGYRYDGLYIATKAWQDVGESGFKVCRIALVRLPGQPKIPIQQGRESEVDNLEELEKTATAVSVSSNEPVTSTPEERSPEDAIREGTAETVVANPVLPRKRGVVDAIEGDDSPGGEVAKSITKRRRSIRNK
ncbi:hypothetical protein JCM16303_007245 [Sporobolomyces ruberrimus]